MKVQAKLDMPSSKWSRQDVSVALAAVLAELGKPGVVVSRSAVTLGKAGQIRMEITFEDVNFSDLDDIADEIYERVFHRLSPGLSPDAQLFGASEFQQFA